VRTSLLLLSVPPSCSSTVSKWFYDTSIGTAPREQPAVVLLLEGLRSHKVLVMRKYGGHEDLRGLGHRSVIPYVHG
jgi:hypothetical protein